MANTANVNIYHLREDVDIDQLVTMLGEKYTPFDLGDTIKRGQNVEILAFQKSKNFPPGWYNLIYKYDTAPCGPLKNYLQLEIDLEGKSYFLLDKYWYVLEREFDKTLIENYSRKVTSNFKNLEFIKKWDTDNENNYNKAYDNPPYSFCFHQINVGHIEFCDIMFVDAPNATTYLIHVKDGIGATIRDLTSQVSIASQIIEGELLVGKSDSLEKLYDQGLQNNRINAQLVTKEDFVSWIKKFRREYILAVHCRDKSKQDIIEGKFESRIAKFCLIEFASQMRSNDHNFSICCI